MDVDAGKTGGLLNGVLLASTIGPFSVGIIQLIYLAYKVPRSSWQNVTVKSVKSKAKLRLAL